MYKLLRHTLNPVNTAAYFAPTSQVVVDLAPPETSYCRDLGKIDCISGGAITNAALYCLARIPAVTAGGRIIEPDRYDFSSLNRCMLSRRSRSNRLKAADLAETLNEGLRLTPVAQLFNLALLQTIAPLAPMLIVGVDDIPSRWAVQEAMPQWLTVGATTHWSAMASFHSDGLACARCLHYEDDPNGGLIPTTACVSFWAGLLMATYLARRTAGSAIPVAEQQTFLSPFRPSSAFPAAVPVRSDCPICHALAGRGRRDAA